MSEWWLKTPCVYIMAGQRNGVLYTGVTSNVLNRVSTHKQDVLEGFTKKYSVHRLVYYEMHETTEQALLRETRIKKWKRSWKIRLIQGMNPEWIDLFDEANATILNGPTDLVRIHTRDHPI